MTWLNWTGAFYQIVSLSSTPTWVFTTTNWSSLVSLLMSLLTNPFFLWVIGIIVIMTILPSVEDD